MRASVESRFRQMWRGERSAPAAGLAVLTAPLTVLFGLGVRARNTLFDRGLLTAHDSPVHVLSVGNLAVGGTGKTPVAAWLADTLGRIGRKPALVLRGYGEDEVLLHRHWHPEVPVIRAARRWRGIAEAAGLGADVVILDDGFQHRAVRRDLDIVLLSPEHSLPPRLLPRGPFREPLSALRRADLVWVTAKGSHELEGARQLADELSRRRGVPPVHVFPFSEGAWTALDGAAAAAPPGVPIVVTSVAFPEPFVRSVRARAGSVGAHLAFRDHHAYTPADAASISASAGSGWVATTEKDAMKLSPLRELLPEVRVLPLVPNPPPPLEAALLAAIGTLEKGGRRA